MSEVMNVTMPDGTVLEGVPIGTSKAEIHAKWQGVQAAPTPSGPDFLGDVKRKAVVAGSALARGALSLPALLAGGSGADTLDKAYGAGAFVQPDPAMQLDSLAPVKQVAALGAHPKTTGEKYLASALEGVGGAMTGPGGFAAPVRTAVLGGASGLGAEAGGQLTDQNPIARLIGALTGGAGAGLLGSAKNTRAGLAQETLRDAKPADLDAAKALMTEALGKGVSLNLSQVMPRASNVDAMVDRLATSRHGTTVAHQLREQPNQIAFGMEAEAGALPGVIREPQIIANNSQAAASEAIANAKKLRTETWRKTFDDTLEVQQAPVLEKLAEAKSVYEAARTKLGQARATDAAAQESAAIEFAAADKAYKAELAAHEAALGTPPPIPSELGSSRGRLLTDSGRGSAIVNSIATYEAQQARLRGQSSLLGADGQPISTAPVFAPPTQRTVMPTTSAAEGEASAASKDLRTARQQLKDTTTVPKEIVTGVLAHLQTLAASVPNTSKSELLQGLRARLLVNGEPLTDPIQINEVLKDVAGKLKPINLATSGLDAGAAKWVGLQINNVRNHLGQSFEPLKAANASYSQMTDEVVNPLVKSVVGRVAQKGGEKDAVEAVKSKIFSVFDAGTTPGAASSEILTLEKAMRKTDPETFQDAVKTWLSTKLSKATVQEGGRLSDDTARRVEHALASNEVQRQGFRDMMVGLARSKGLPDNALLPGMERMLKITSAASRRPASAQGVGVSELDEISRSRLLSSAGSFNVLTPLRQFARRANDALNADAYTFMDKLLTSPEGIDMLRKLGQKQPISTAMLNTISTLTATAAVTPPPQSEK